MKKSVKVGVVAGVSVLFATACGTYPAWLSTAWGIRFTRSGVHVIGVSHLPLRDFPLLAKFTRARGIIFDSRRGTFATDAKLKALASLGLTNVAWITMTNCRLVTDAGIRALVRMPSLTGLGLEGTAITDSACKVMALQMRLAGVNVANCDRITLKGITALAKSNTIQDISFSTDGTTRDQVLHLIGTATNITHWEIVDPQHRLDAKAVEAMAARTKTQVLVRPTGALQDMYGIEMEGARRPVSR
jgi:hypothetical protein